MGLTLFSLFIGGVVWVASAATVDGWTVDDVELELCACWIWIKVVVLKLQLCVL